MKKIDVTQPYAMTSPFADGVYSSVSTSDFEIPADTSTAPDDTCVIDDGFLPITSTDLDDGGIAPERKNFNGMFYLSTDQRFYLQNGGFITYNSNVATAIGGYPQDAVLGYIDGQGTYKLVRSLIDDNTNDFTLDETLIDGEHWEEIAMGGGGSGYQMFDIVMKDHVLSYEETLGLAPLGTYVYKEAIAGTRYGYPDFYQKCVDEYNDGTTINEYMSSNITVVGSLTDNEGVISGFSTSNYATVGNFIGTTADTIEFVIKLNTGSTLSANTFLYAGFSIQFYNGKLNLTGTGNIGTYTYSANTDYYIKVTYSNNTIECAYSTDGISYTIDGTISYTGTIQNLIYLGWGNVNNALSGSIDLNECYININGTRWWNGINLFTYTENSNKHRFYDIADKATFDNMYAITGEAWYYGIDTTNERIFLPRSTRFKNGTTSDVGEYQEAGLPSIEHTHSLAMASSDSGDTLIDRGSGSTIRWSTGGINSTISSIYGNSDTVEYSSTKLIPYMVVGNQSTWSGMTDVVNQGMTILSQVNAGLATKVDLDGSNATFPHIIDTYVNGLSGYIVYSNGYCVQWGYGTVNNTPISLLKTFDNTDYSIFAIPSSSTSGSSYPAHAFWVGSKTVNSFVWGGSSNDNGYWRVYGKLAEGQY